MIPVTTEFADAEISSSSAMQNGAGVSIGLETAKVITAAVRAAGKERGLKPLTVVVLDAGGNVVVGVSDNDELAAIAGITPASLVPQPG